MRLDKEMAVDRCPYCGERIELVIDPSVPAQEYTEDCAVCCRPIVISVRVEVTEQGHSTTRADVAVRREDDG